MFAKKLNLPPISLRKTFKTWLMIVGLTSVMLPASSTFAVTIDELSEKALEVQNLNKDIEIQEKKNRLQELRNKVSETDLEHGVKKKELHDKLTGKKTETTGAATSNVASTSGTNVQGGAAADKFYLLDRVGDDIVLTAIYGRSDNPTAEVSYRGSVFALKRGESVNGWRATQIGKDRVVLSKSTGQVGKKGKKSIVSKTKTIYLASPDVALH